MPSTSGILWETDLRMCMSDTPAGPTITISKDRFDAVIFDMDGVVTDTARTHSAAWKRMFDEYLRERAESTGEPFVEFTDDDYRRYVDGIPRVDGAMSFLESRGITLPVGEPIDPPGSESVWAVANRKNGFFLQSLDEDGANPYPSTVALVHELKAAGIETAIITSSKNRREVLSAAGVQDLFETNVDGIDIEEDGIPGKPDPGVFLEAARRVGVEPSRAVVVEDALKGVEAGRRGAFGLVIGVDRLDQAEDLLARGADVVVRSLSEVVVATG